MPSYVAINDSEQDPGAPITSSLGYRWRDNPIAMAQNTPGAPAGNWISQVQVLSGSGTYTVPSTCYRIRVTVIGAGEGGGDVSTAGSPGGDTVFGAYTAPGGGSATVASAADINTAQNPDPAFVSSARAGVGGPSPLGGGGATLGAGGSGDVLATRAGGQSGAMLVKTISVTPGDTFAYSIGAGGAAGAGGSGSTAGQNGTIIVEY